jgi:hypothetical protein
MTIFRQVYTKSSAGMQAVVDKFEEIEKQKKWDATFRVSSLKNSLILTEFAICLRRKDKRDGFGK